MFQALDISSQRLQRASLEFGSGYNRGIVTIDYKNQRVQCARRQGYQFEQGKGPVVGGRPLIILCQSAELQDGPTNGTELVFRSVMVTNSSLSTSECVQMCRPQKRKTRGRNLDFCASPTPLNKVNYPEKYKGKFFGAFLLSYVINRNHIGRVY